jgi:hypothetical protein
MSLLRIRSGAEQVADHLRGEIMGGRWKETIPGIHQSLPMNSKLAENTIVVVTTDNGCSSQANFDALAKHDHHPS